MGRKMMEIQLTEEEQKVLDRHGDTMLVRIAGDKEEEEVSYEIELMAEQFDIPQWKLARWLKKQQDSVKINLRHHQTPEQREARVKGRKRLNEAVNGGEEPEAPARQQARQPAKKKQMTTEERRKRAQECFETTMRKVLAGEQEFRQADHEEAEAGARIRREEAMAEVRQLAEEVREGARQELPMEFVPDGKYITVRVLAGLLEQFADDTVITCGGRPIHKIETRCVYGPSGVTLETCDLKRGI